MSKKGVTIWGVTWKFAFREEFYFYQRYKNEIEENKKKLIYGPWSSQRPLASIEIKI